MGLNLQNSMTLNSPASLNALVNELNRVANLLASGKAELLRQKAQLQNLLDNHANLKMQLEISNRYINRKQKEIQNLEREFQLLDHDTLTNE